MDTVLIVSIYLIFALIALCGIALLVFGVRNLSFGKVNVFTSIVVIVPFVLAVALSLFSGDWVYGSIIACLVALAITMGTLLLLGARGLFGA